MSSKIVQLVDKDGENIYPVTDTTKDVVLDYSLQEVNTHIKWIDKKDIYKRTYQFAYHQGDAWNTFGKLNDFSAVPKVEGYYLRNDGIITDCPRATVQFFVDTNGDLKIQDYDNIGGTMRITVYYTKSS